MDVLVAGGHGKIGLRLLGLLAARGDRARGLIRNADHAADLEALGAEPVVADLEQLEDIAPYIEGADAVVFAAGAGPGSGPERKRTVDLGGALKLIDGVTRAGTRRYVMVSSIGAHDPGGATEQMRPYLEAKAEADGALVAAGLDFTIVRPGSLTDDVGSGAVALTTELGGRGKIPRDDVATILLACLDMPETIGLTFEAFRGQQPIEYALRALRRAT
ncbi:MAG: hypothetical protein QOJ29_4904 [Thermoleophilaceae bacterium]|nr:hypothetical protein [Thermoleophilaceae bacterium]